MAYLASNSATGSSDVVTIPGTGFSGASAILLGVMLPFPGQTVTWPSGFTQLTTANNSGASRGNAAEMLFAYGTTVAANYVCTVGGGGGTTPIGFAVALSGRNGSTPTNFTVSNNVAGSASPVSVAMAGVTAAAGDDIVWIGCTNFCPTATTWTWTAPSGYTSRQNLSKAGASGVSFDVSTLDNQTGATGTITGVATNAGATGGADALGLVIAFSVAGGAGAALAGVASDATSATAALTTSPGAFAPISIGIGAAANDGTGDPARTAFSKVNSMMAQLYGTRSVQTPTTGFTITVAQGVTKLILNPAGTLATGTVTFPPNPGDNQPFTLMSSQTITALTSNTSDGSSINGSPSGLSANAAARFNFILSLNKWFREQ